MLEVIEGKPPLPRWYPPYEHGLFATAPQLGWEATPRSGSGGGPNPTLVNNVETLANVPHILARGPEWFRSMGTPESPGTIVATVVGDVIAPDVGEVELGTSLRDVIDGVGSGIAPGRAVKAVFSGVANPVDRRRPARRAGQLRGLPGDRQRHGRRRVHRLRRHDVHGRRRLPAVEIPVDRVVRPVPALQARLERDHQPPRTTGDRRRQRRRPAHGSGTGWRGSPTATAATSPSRNNSWSTASCKRSPKSSPNTSSSAGAHAHGASRSPSSSTSPTARPCTTTRSGGNAPTGPTNPTSEVLSEPAARRARAGCRPDRDRTFDPCSFPDADGTNVPPVTHRANLVAAPAMASARPPGSKASSSSRSVRSTRGASGRATRSSTTPVTAAQPTRPRVSVVGEPVPGPMSASSKCRRRTRPGTTPHTTRPAPGPPGPKCRTRRSSAIDEAREIARSFGPGAHDGVREVPFARLQPSARHLHRNETSPTSSLRCAHAAMNQRSSGAGEGSARVVRCGVGPPTPI